MPEIGTSGSARSGLARLIDHPVAASAFSFKIVADMISSSRSDLNDHLPSLLLHPGHDLTGIYRDRYIPVVESAFAIIAEPNRRAILSLLASSERFVSEIERSLRIPQPSVSKHLRVLREAGFVESRIDAQRRLYRIKPEPLKEVDAWLAPFRHFWSAHLDALERHLDRTDQVSRRRKGRKR
jgi:DNA-binding transcriptional ArsR family regulator